MSRVDFMHRTLLVDAPGELIFVRHGQQRLGEDADPDRKYAGDPSLSDLGARQAEAAAQALANEHLDAIYASPMRRAFETAAPIAAAHGITPVVDPAWVEIQGFRDLPPGMSVDEAVGAPRLDAMGTFFLAHRRWDAMPLSESSHEFQARIGGAFQRLLDAHGEEERVAVVCHSGVINVIVAMLLGLHADMITMVSHGSVTRIGRGDGRLVLRGLNQDQHVRDAGLLSA